MFFPTITFTLRQAIHPARAAPSSFGGCGSRLLNNERTELGGPDETISLEEDADVSLEEGLRRRLCIYDNFMTRFLWGGESIYGELPSPMPSSARRTTSPTSGSSGSGNGWTSRFVLLGRKLGIGLMPYYLRHVSTKRPPIEETSRELRELVAEHNALDVELYRFARELFEESAPPPDELTDEVAELRRRSVEVTEASAAQRKTRKEQGKQKRRDRKAAGLSRRPTGTPAAEGGGTKSPRCPRPRSDAGGSPGQREVAARVSTGTPKRPGPARRRTSKTKRRVSQTLLSDFSSAA